MSESKLFPVGAAASLTSGYLLSEFGQMAELSEWLMGYPIWTHQYPRLAGELRAAALAQHPGLPTRETIGTVTIDNWTTIVAGLESRLGASLLFAKGSGAVPQREPLAELVDLVGADRVAVVKA